MWDDNNMLLKSSVTSSNYTAIYQKPNCLPDLQVACKTCKCFLSIHKLARLLYEVVRHCAIKHTQG